MERKTYRVSFFGMASAAVAAAVTLAWQVAMLVWYVRLEGRPIVDYVQETSRTPMAPHMRALLAAIQPVLKIHWSWLLVSLPAAAATCAALVWAMAIPVRGLGARLALAAILLCAPLLFLVPSLCGAYGAIWTAPGLAALPLTGPMAIALACPADAAACRHAVPRYARTMAVWVRQDQMSIVTGQPQADMGV